MKRRYTAPTGFSYDLYEDMTIQTHLLVAGATGSGKSVVINGILTTLLLRVPSKAGLILIDPKRVELSPYRNIPHTLRYASEPQEMAEALYYAMHLCDMRYKEMQARGERKYSGGDVYVVIDEYADLMSIDKQKIAPPMCPVIQRLAQIGRASKIHLIVATQCPLASVISTPIKCNIDSRVGLHTRSKGDSTNILGHAGLEELPEYGQGVYMKPTGETLYYIPYVPEAEQNRLIKWWEAQTIKKRRFAFF